MPAYVGDFFRGDNVDVWWDSANSLGASANPSSAGTVFVCVSHNSSSVTQVGVTSTTGIFAGVHCVRVSTASATAFFLPERNYSVVLSNFTVDGQLINKVVGQFSIEYRYETGLIQRGTLLNASASAVSLAAAASSLNSFYDGATILISDNTGKLQARMIASYASAGQTGTPDRNFITAPANGSTYRLYAGSLPSTDSELADSILTRNIATGSNGGRNVSSALMPLRNKVTTGGSTMTVFGTDDSTSAWTASITTAGSALASIDPQ